jgi:hypothetical protein
VRVVRVGLATVTGVEQPNPSRELCRNVDNVLAISDQPLSK